MAANFNQVVKAGKREVSNSFGEMALNRPGRFRWKTKSPLEQLVIADSKKLWIYDIELEQVTVKKQEKGIGGTPGLFLSGYDDTVARDFNVSSTTKDKTQIYDLQAKSSKENYQRVKLTFKGELLTAIELFDQLGQHTTVRLSKIKNNPTLPSDLFQFKPPKGVDIVVQ
jgi:outer membrane lipoprotein carrier protein